MQLFQDFFPADSTVSTRIVDGRLCVSVFTARPKPDWLLKNQSTLRGNLKITDKALREEILRLVRLKPGLAGSSYVRLPIKAGGVAGSQERKETTLRELISTGLIVKKELTQNMGRKTHELYAV
jgi:hypothetical protein